MATIHLMLQNRAVGKTLLASLLVQYLCEQFPRQVICVNADSVHEGLSCYKALCPAKIKVNQLIAYCSNIPPEISQIVIDTNYIDFAKLCEQMQTLSNQLKEHGHRLQLHTVVAGGMEALYTFKGVHTLTSNCPDLPLIVWLNPFYGWVNLEGWAFEKSKLYQENRQCYRALLELREITRFLRHKAGESCQEYDLARNTLLKNITAPHTVKETLQSNFVSIEDKAAFTDFYNEIKAMLDAANLGANGQKTAKQ